MKLGYICTNYNNSAFTRTAVETLSRNIGHEIQVVVVDNNSDAANVELLKAIKADFPNVELQLNQENLGYFPGLNVGIRALRQRRPDIEWMVIGNNDLEFHEDFVDKLQANVERLKAYPVVSPDVITLDGEHQNPHVVASISKTRELFYDAYYSNYHVGMAMLKLAMMFRSVSDRTDEQQWETAQPIYQGHGSVYVMGPAFFREFGELWAPTFMMSEEYFLSKQLSDAGYQVWYDPCLQVVHHYHGALATLPSRRRWEMARDAHREYRKYVRVLG